MQLLAKEAFHLPQHPLPVVQQAIEGFVSSLVVVCFEHCTKARKLALEIVWVVLVVTHATI